MLSLKDRVAHQRDTLIARGPDIRLRAERIHKRLRHPALLIPAFLGGMLAARGAPPVLHALPRVTARLRNTTEALRKLDTIVKLSAALPLILLRLSDAELSTSSHRKTRQEVLP
ncbi:hypothetical protein [Halorhodospira sp. M38]|uniref:hypothetical protein n=1 Tax=Halorhodospira sp. M38 TaxID=2899130 RepID=UPI001EE98CB9|nr:hypothetical protein [Halorhodospira sp. M38]MCG5539704.1 hypothetical protein [Halorhodospira sp. M39old]MCG5545514.1 hypothetical protein [Halorhodospira sp. M38]